jgi:hypothetical protein
MQRVRIVLVIGIVAAVVAILAAQQVGGKAGGSFGDFLTRLTPSGIAQQHAGCPLVPGSFLAQTRALGDRELVLYHALCQADSGRPSDEIVGEHLVRRTGISWESLGGGYAGGLRPPVPDAVQTVSVTRGESVGNEHTIVSGSVPGPTVSQVEVIFGNGQVLRDRVTDTLFGVMASGVVGVCELRTMDDQDHIIERINLATPENNMLVGQQPIPLRCP